eukprot:GHVN01087614.1.p1 GENE.GHVN01087614.1~~GHVN01087614.1.p1  ORF type:complete len:1991 (-),score=216.84 GHVN01087614.1:26-5998(-)
MQYDHIERLSQSLNMIFDSRNEIVQILFELLESDEGGVCRASILLIGALARDLSNEFVPFFTEFFEKGVSILSKTEDIDLFWAAIDSMSISFRISTKKKPQEYICFLYRHLLNEREYVRRLAAEMVGYLLRHSKNTKEAVLTVLNLTDCAKKIQGTARVFVSACKGVLQGLHSTSKRLLDILLGLMEDGHYLMCGERILAELFDSFDGKAISELLFYILENLSFKKLFLLKFLPLGIKKLDGGPEEQYTVFRRLCKGARDFPVDDILEVFISLLLSSREKTVEEVFTMVIDFFSEEMQIVLFGRLSECEWGFFEKYAVPLLEKRICEGDQKESWLRIYMGHRKRNRGGVLIGKDYVKDKLKRREDVEGLFVFFTLLDAIPADVSALLGEASEGLGIHSELFTEDIDLRKLLEIYNADLGNLFVLEKIEKCSFEMTEDKRRDLLAWDGSLASIEPRKEIRGMVSSLYQRCYPKAKKVFEYIEEITRLEGCIENIPKISPKISHLKMFFSKEKGFEGARNAFFLLLGALVSPDCLLWKEIEVFVLDLLQGLSDVDRGAAGRIFVCLYEESKKEDTKTSVGFFYTEYIKPHKMKRPRNIIERIHGCFLDKRIGGDVFMWAMQKLLEEKGREEYFISILASANKNFCLVDGREQAETAVRILPGFMKRIVFSCTLVFCASQKAKRIIVYGTNEKTNAMKFFIALNGVERHEKAFLCLLNEREAISVELNEDKGAIQVFCDLLYEILIQKRAEFRKRLFSCLSRDLLPVFAPLMASRRPKRLCSARLSLICYLIEVHWASLDEGVFQKLSVELEQCLLVFLEDTDRESTSLDIFKRILKTKYENAPLVFERLCPALSRGLCEEKISGLCYELIEQFASLRENRIFFLNFNFVENIFQAWNKACIGPCLDRLFFLLSSTPEVLMPCRDDLVLYLCKEETQRGRDASAFVTLLGSLSETNKIGEWFSTLSCFIESMPQDILLKMNDALLSKFSMFSEALKKRLQKGDLYLAYAKAFVEGATKKEICLLFKAVFELEPSNRKADVIAEIEKICLETEKDPNALATEVAGCLDTDGGLTVIGLRLIKLLEVSPSEKACRVFDAFMNVLAKKNNAHEKIPLLSSVLFCGLQQLCINAPSKNIFWCYETALLSFPECFSQGTVALARKNAFSGLFLNSSRLGSLCHIEGNGNLTDNTTLILLFVILKRFSLSTENIFVEKTALVLGEICNKIEFKEYREWIHSLRRMLESKEHGQHERIIIIFGAVFFGWSSTVPEEVERVLGMLYAVVQKKDLPIVRLKLLSSIARLVKKHISGYEGHAKKWLSAVFSSICLTKKIIPFVLDSFGFIASLFGFPIIEAVYRTRKEQRKIVRSVLPALIERGLVEIAECTKERVLFHGLSEEDYRGLVEMTGLKTNRGLCSLLNLLSSEQLRLELDFITNRKRFESRQIRKMKSQVVSSIVSRVEKSTSELEHVKWLLKRRSADKRIIGLSVVDSICDCMSDSELRDISKRVEKGLKKTGDYCIVSFSVFDKITDRIPLVKAGRRVRRRTLQALERPQTKKHGTSVLRILSKLLRLEGGLDDSEAMAILRIVSEDVETYLNEQGVFGLLEEIIARKIMSVDLKNTMAVLKEHIGKVITEKTRNSCCRIYTAYLLVHFSSSDALERELVSIFQAAEEGNEAYKVSFAVIVRILISDAPREVLQKLFDFLFISLCTVIANTTNIDTVSIDIMRGFIEKADGPGVARILFILQKWASLEKEETDFIVFRICGLLLSIHPEVALKFAGVCVERAVLLIEKIKEGCSTERVFYALGYFGKFLVSAGDSKLLEERKTLYLLTSLLEGLFPEPYAVLRDKTEIAYFLLKKNKLPIENGPTIVRQCINLLEYTLSEEEATKTVNGILLVIKKSMGQESEDEVISLLRNGVEDLVSGLRRCSGLAQGLIRTLAACFVHFREWALQSVCGLAFSLVRHGEFDVEIEGQCAELDRILRECMPFSEYRRRQAI